MGQKFSTIFKDLFRFGVMYSSNNSPLVVTLLLPFRVVVGRVCCLKSGKIDIANNNISLEQDRRNF